MVVFIFNLLPAHINKNFKLKNCGNYLLKYNKNTIKFSQFLNNFNKYSHLDKQEILIQKSNFLCFT